MSEQTVLDVLATASRAMSAEDLFATNNFGDEAGLRSCLFAMSKSGAIVRSFDRPFRYWLPGQKVRFAAQPAAPVQRPKPVEPAPAPLQTAPVQTAPVVEPVVQKPVVELPKTQGTAEMRSPYEPMDGSKTAKIIAYIQLQPDHVATRVAIGRQFGYDHKNIAPLLKSADSNGWCHSVKWDDQAAVKLMLPALSWKPAKEDLEAAMRPPMIEAPAPKPKPVKAEKVVPKAKNLVLPAPSEEVMARAQLEASGKPVARGVDYGEVLSDLRIKLVLVQNAITSIEELAGLPG